MSAPEDYTMIELPPPGEYGNPVRLDGPIAGAYPEEFAGRPHIWVLPKDGVRTKWYRSYADYCD